MKFFIKLFFFRPPDTSVLLGPNIYFATFLSIILYQPVLLKSTLMQKEKCPQITQYIFCRLFMSQSDSLVHIFFVFKKIKLN